MCFSLCVTKALTDSGPASYGVEIRASDDFVSWNIPFCDSSDSLFRVFSTYLEQKAQLKIYSVFHLDFYP